MKPVFSAVVCAVALCGSAIAQGPTLRLSTETAVGVFAQDGALADLQFVAANTALLNPISLSASAAQARATTTASPSLPAGVGLRITQSGLANRAGAGSDPSAGTTNATTRPAIAPGAQGFVATIGGPLQGRIVITLLGDASQGARAGASVDVGADGSFEFQGSVDGTPQVIAVPVNAVQSLDLRIVTTGFAGTPGATVASNYRADLTVAFQADGACEITPYGQGCGPQLGGIDQLRGNQHVFTFRVSGGFPSSPITYVFGDRRINFPLPGFNCPLLANPLALVNVMADANGDAVTVVSTPGPLSGVATMQALPFAVAPGGALRLRASNGIAIDCDA